MDEMIKVFGAWRNTYEHELGVWLHTDNGVL